MDPADYMLMPYIDYDEPVMSKCILGIDGYKENQMPDSPVLTFGQRFLAKFSMMVVYNRAAGTVQVAITEGTPSDDFPALSLSLCFVPGIGIFLILVYLISLKRKRMRAEEWLDTHNDILFGTTWGSMSEIEILESLVKNRGLATALANPSQSSERSDTRQTESGTEDGTSLQSESDGKSSSSEERKTKSSMSKNSQMKKSSDTGIAQTSSSGLSTV